MTRDRLERPPPKRERRPAGTRAAHLENNNNARDSRHLRAAQGHPIAADFCLARHLLHEKLLPPSGYAWLFFRQDGQLWVQPCALDTLWPDPVPSGAEA